jgi:hypothetical protein
LAIAGVAVVGTECACKCDSVGVVPWRTSGLTLVSEYIEVVFSLAFVAIIAVFTSLTSDWTRWTYDCVVLEVSCSWNTSATL